MVLLQQNVTKKINEFNFLNPGSALEEIKLFHHREFIILSNGCRIRAIKASQTLPIMERFGIDNWARRIKLKDCLTQEQIEELWLSCNHDIDFVLSVEELNLFIF